MKYFLYILVFYNIKTFNYKLKNYCIDGTNTMLGYCLSVIRMFIYNLYKIMIIVRSWDK